MKKIVDKIKFQLKSRRAKEKELKELERRVSGFSLNHEALEAKKEWIKQTMEGRQNNRAKLAAVVSQKVMKAVETEQAKLPELNGRIDKLKKALNK